MPVAIRSPCGNLRYYTAVWGCGLPRRFAPRNDVGVLQRSEFAVRSCDNGRCTTERLLIAPTLQKRMVKTLQGRLLSMSRMIADRSLSAKKACHKTRLFVFSIIRRVRSLLHRACTGGIQYLRADLRLRRPSRRSGRHNPSYLPRAWVLRS